LVAEPGWVDRLIIAFAVYVAVGAVWMLSGAGGPKVSLWLGLLYKMPAELIAIIVAFATARGMVVPRSCTHAVPHRRLYRPYLLADGYRSLPGSFRHPLLRVLCAARGRSAVADPGCSSARALGPAVPGCHDFRRRLRRLLLVLRGRARCDTRAARNPQRG